MTIYNFFFKGVRLIFNIVINQWHYLQTRVLLTGNAVIYSTFRTHGVPYIMVAKGGEMIVGEKFSMNNGIHGNPIGCNERCTFFVDKDCSLIIGDNVGISQSALVSHSKLTIGNNVKIGGGTCIFTTDFHSLDPNIRSTKEDLKYRKSAPVTIHDNAFIGAKCIILKGVTIGENSIIGAGSVVTKDIPANQIWGGNPATFIKKL